MSDALIQRLVSEIRAAILLLNREDKGGHAITPDQADDRARNIVQGLMVNYEIRELPQVAAVDFNDPLIAGRPIGHSWSCKCSQGCADYHLKLKERI